MPDLDAWLWPPATITQSELRFLLLEHWMAGSDTERRPSYERLHALGLMPRCEWLENA